MISKNSFFTNYINNNHPSTLIIPYREEDIFKNAEINKNNRFNLQQLLEERYPGKYVTITYNGRKALEIALDNDLKKNQKVLVQTTSDNFYISSCVTKSIEVNNFWHRESNKSFDKLLINHEFGFVDNRISEMAEKPLIEDCAFAFNSRYLNGNRCGTIAPYSIFSFSKFFPIAMGGCLVSDEPIHHNEKTEIHRYISNVVGYYFNKVEEWTSHRKNIYNYYLKVFKQLGCDEYFKPNAYDVPGVFLFKVPENVGLEKLKKFYWERGIQCSVFYGTQAFFLPLHQNISKMHVDYFADLFYFFINNCDE